MQAAAQQFLKVQFPVVGIGASAGGIEAFNELLSHLPVDSGMAFVCIQHLDPTHTSLLTEILAKATRMLVSEAGNGMRVEPNHVYVIPPNRSMTISDGVLKLEARSVNHIDIFLHSLAKEQGTRAIAVILSGTANDGCAGIKSIREGGGTTFAQDAETAKFEEMPQNAIETGYIDFILAPKDIAKSLVSENNSAFEQIVHLLRKRSGVDFGSYKPATIKRRIIRRMIATHNETLKDYLAYLENSPLELEILSDDVLITITSFFRDPEIFKTIETEIFPQIIQNKPPDAPIRIWAPACSTGEEVYSLAITLLEQLGDDVHHHNIQFFGSDIKESCIEAARAGIYPPSIQEMVSPERLKRFFNRVERGYQINKQIRDRCVFAKQNVAGDPPFSRMDLISCRNLLIYLAPPLQQKVLLTFHYALNSGGFLLLGPSEGVLDFGDAFEAVNPKGRIYARKETTARRKVSYFPSPHTPEILTSMTKYKSHEESTTLIRAQREADRVVMAKYEPAGVVIDDNLEIIQFRGDTSSYLRLVPGTPTLNLLKMAREGLLTALRTGVSEVRRSGISYKKDDIQIKYHSTFKRVSIEVIPLQIRSDSQQHFLIVFADTTDITPPTHAEGMEELSPAEKELIATKAYAQSIIDEHQATNAELRAANEKVVSTNEELQSLNEEMQSANEELQTAKEELQASNEEISTVNDELNERNIELSHLNDDFINLTNSIQLPIVIVGSDSCTRLFTPAAEKIFNFVATDLGRPLNNIKLKFNMPNLAELITQVIKDLRTTEQNIEGEEGRWYKLKIQPYRTSDQKIDGAVLTFEDITTAKQREQQLIELNTALKKCGEELVNYNRDLQAIANDKLDPKAFELIKMASEAANRAQAVISDLLDYSSSSH